MATYDLKDVALILRSGDDVATALQPLFTGDELRDGGRVVTLCQDVPPGHKVALRELEEGASVRKYGQIIGFATQAVGVGEHVHTHNCAVRDYERDYAIGSEVRPVQFVPEGERRTFEGYLRPDGRVGTRNYIALISSVNCSATTVRWIADRFRGDALRAFPNVDGVIPLTHKNGCGTKFGSPELGVLQRTLAGFAKHPNVAAYVLVALGCETNQVSSMIENQGLLRLDHEMGRGPVIVAIQGSGGIAKAVEAGVRQVAQMLPEVDAWRRTTQPASKLAVALQCGGSDGYSGITANPALGAAVDELVRHGGTAVLSETPEIYGAEHLLTRRAVTEAAAKRLIGQIHWWERYTAMHGFEMDSNPAPGNKAGGLTTIYEKSLGAVAKGGTTPLTAVYDYAERIVEPGFVYMDSPGYDPVSVTGQVAGGCNLVAFTTGRGSCFGFKPSPSIKIATSSRLYQHMIDDMDVNGGAVLEGRTIEEVGEEIFELLLAVASGQKSKSEAQGVGEEEFNPWILGATM
jgi:altronate hydrolase